jgi:hypothetical protein
MAVYREIPTVAPMAIGIYVIGDGFIVFFKKITTGIRGWPK